MSHILICDDTMLIYRRHLSGLIWFCNLSPLTLLGSSVHGILQARILEWVAMSSSRGFSDPGIERESLMYPALAGRFFFFFKFPIHILLWGIKILLGINEINKEEGKQKMKYKQEQIRAGRFFTTSSTWKTPWRSKTI